MPGGIEPYPVAEIEACIVILYEKSYRPMDKCIGIQASAKAEVFFFLSVNYGCFMFVNQTFMTVKRVMHSVA